MRADERKDARVPLPRRSTPAPTPTPTPPPRFRISRGWILFALVLLAFNFYLGSRATQPQSRVRVPFSPFFLEQVSAGHVKEFTS
jgi:cell division protease FtsH